MRYFHDAPGMPGFLDLHLHWFFPDVLPQPECLFPSEAALHTFHHLPDRSHAQFRADADLHYPDAEVSGTLLWKSSYGRAHDSP